MFTIASLLLTSSKSEDGTFVLLKMALRGKYLDIYTGFLGFCNKIPQSGWVKTTEIYSVREVESRSKVKVSEQLYFFSRPKGIPAVVAEHQP